MIQVSPDVPQASAKHPRVKLASTVATASLFDESTPPVLDDTGGGNSLPGDTVEKRTDTGCLEAGDTVKTPETTEEVERETDALCSYLAEWYAKFSTQPVNLNTLIGPETEIRLRDGCEIPSFLMTEEGTKGGTDDRKDAHTDAGKRLGKMLAELHNQVVGGYRIRDLSGGFGTYFQLVEDGRLMRDEKEPEDGEETVIRDALGNEMVPPHPWFLRRGYERGLVGNARSTAAAASSASSSARAILDKLGKRGVDLMMEDEELIWEAPKGVVTEALLDELRAAKPALIAYFTKDIYRVALKARARRLKESKSSDPFTKSNDLLWVAYNFANKDVMPIFPVQLGPNQWTRQPGSFLLDAWDKMDDLEEFHYHQDGDVWHSTVEGTIAAYHIEAIAQWWYSSLFHLHWERPSYRSYVDSSNEYHHSPAVSQPAAAPMNTR